VASRNPVLPALAPIPMSYEDWLAWSGDAARSEWDDGEAIPFMPPKMIHQTLVSFLDRVLGLFVDLHGIGRVFVGPFEMRLPRSAREPDVAMLLTENLGRKTAERVVGPADLVVEIVSDDSVGRDRLRKFAEYAEAGVREYWIGDPRPGRGTLEGFALGPGGYEPIPPDPDGRIPSRVAAGFRFDPAWFDGSEPDVLAALRAVLPEHFGG
jgi:Uma2 family endonuclease